MSHRTQHVVRCEVQVEFAVLSDREAVDLFVNGESFVPEFHKLYRKSVEETHVGLDSGSNFLNFNVFVGRMRARRLAGADLERGEGHDGLVGGGRRSEDLQAERQATLHHRVLHIYVRAADARGAFLDLAGDGLLDEGEQLGIGVHSVRTDVHDEGAGVRHDVVLRTGLDHRHGHLDGSQIRRHLRETVVPEPVDVLQGLVDGVYALLAGGVAALAAGGAVQHHQALLGNGHLHSRRLSYDAEGDSMNVGQIPQQTVSNDAEIAYRCVMECISENAAHFDGTSGIEVWGAVRREFVLVDAKQLRRLLQSRGLNYDAVKRGMRDNGYLIPSPDGKYARHTRCNEKKAQFVKIKKETEERMKTSSFYKKRIIHICAIAFVVVMIVLTAGWFMLKYSVEGEKNLPFNLKKISIISSAESHIGQDAEEKWHAGILQKNDIFITLEKNENYKKTDTIKEIKLENFTISKAKDEHIITIYRPATNDLDYTYSDEYKIENEIVIKGAQESNAELLTINNQGGVIGFSITAGNLGEYNFSINEKVPSDGKLLAKAGLKTEDVSFKVSFDLIIETGNGNKFKSTITIDLPTGNILEEGVSKSENTDFSNVVFKRIK